MARFSAHAGSYQNACNLIEQLKFAGIESNITAGGIAIYCDPDRVNDAKAICRELGASFKGGYTSHQEDVMMRSRDGCEKLEEITNDAISVIKEWK
jgi:hypothetical protein